MTELLREPALYVGGQWVAGGGDDCEVENPAAEQTTGVVTQAASQDVDDALAAAHGAFEGWAGTAVAERAAALRRLHQVITDRADTFAELINREQGSPPPVARKLHVDVPLAVIDRTADAVETELRHRFGLHEITVHVEPC